MTESITAESLASRSLSIARPLRWWEFATPLLIVTGADFICSVGYVVLDGIDSELAVFPPNLLRVTLLGSGIASFGIIEKRILDSGIPQAEIFRQIGQWAPWAASILVGIGTVVYRLSGLDNDKDQSRRTLFELDHSPT
ncbi:hypothetical protein BGW36DRAFT_460426 [Talaromyces proteolyticus]|uniref:Uncharacterized protein n=1 Tax=Talaromyces proteolyticus TaxID=1131652 RepID=A0AAD4KR07_9EURO|nr:uncharacterized protein BGW36DRAFT_460426 [Talaromyces proteolyticus]KAH8698525.1 hypothetical protein BGW36DRAFT_460426 [Talaromyces proteolyticus]